MLYNISLSLILYLVICISCPSTLVLPPSFLLKWQFPNHSLCYSFAPTHCFLWTLGSKTA